MEKYQRIEILWLDCEGFADSGWVDIAEVEKHYGENSSSKMTSLGYFLMETDTDLIVARTLQYDDGIARVEGVMAIPLGCILKIRQWYNR